jgi:uncharacterized Fe-S center protein
MPQERETLRSRSKLNKPARCRNRTANNAIIKKGYLHDNGVIRAYGCETRKKESLPINNKRFDYRAQIAYKTATMTAAMTMTVFGLTLLYAA